MRKLLLAVGAALALATVGPPALADEGMSKLGHYQASVDVAQPDAMPVRAVFHLLTTDAIEPVLVSEKKEAGRKRAEEEKAKQRAQKGRQAALPQHWRSS